MGLEITSARMAPACAACGYPLEGAPCAACGGQVVAGPDGPAIRPGRRFFLLDIAHGFAVFFLAGLQLILRPEYFGKLRLPLLANLAALVALFAGTWLGLYQVFDWLTAQSWGWLDFLRGPVSWTQPVFALAMTVIAFVLLAPAVIEVITSPFLDPLAATVETMLGGPGIRAVERSFWHGTLAGLRATAEVLALQAIVLIPSLFLSFCGVGFLLAFVVAAALNAVLWFEIPFARRGYDSRERLRVLRHNWARALGFGLAFQLGLFVPLFNVLLIAPAAVVAVSTLYFHLEKDPPRGNVAGESRSA